MGRRASGTVDEKSTVQLGDIDVLSETVGKNLKKQFKDLDLSYLSDDESITDVKEWISTGSSLLDLRISNRPNGGIPVGRVTEILGLEGSGKSLLAAHILANTQKKGGLGFLIDSEFAISKEFMKAIGIDTKGPNKIYVAAVEKINDAFAMIESIINTVRASDKDKLVTIVVDSVAAFTTEGEMEADFGKDGYMTEKSIVMSKGLRKITNLIGKQRIAVVFTNQFRTKMNAPAFADPYTTPGGMALKYHSSVRIKLTGTGALRKKDEYGIEQIVGNSVEAKVIKNRVGPPHRKAKFDILFDSGIDDYSSWLKTLVDYKVVSQGGAYYTYQDQKFMAKNFPQLLRENPSLKEEFYQKICGFYVMEYKKNGETIDEDIVLDETEIIE